MLYRGNPGYTRVKASPVLCPSTRHQFRESSQRADHQGATHKTQGAV